ncbi:MAG: hypothetical protein AB1705_25085 [Verrucomicrobiota bacterium]
MCYFITLILPVGNARDISVIDEILSRVHRTAEILSNPHLSQHLHLKERYLYPGGKMCECGTALGTLRETQPPKRIEKKEIDGLRKKGWSETKIQRWIEQQMSVKERKAQIKAKQDLAAHGSDPDGWTATVRALISEARLPYVGLLLHWYSGDLESERIPIKSRVKLPNDDQLSNALYRIEEDTIYEIHR